MLRFVTRTCAPQIELRTGNTEVSQGNPPFFFGTSKKKHLEHFYSRAKDLALPLPYLPPSSTLVTLVTNNVNTTLIPLFSLHHSP